jgi:cyclopropane-fatty-acyl-phospholipid synthase
MKSFPLEQGADRAPSGQSLIDRLSRRMVFSMISRFDRAPIRLLMPDGSTQLAGRESPGKPAVDLTIHNERFFRRILLDGEIGFGEGYMEGDWSTPDLPRMLSALIDNLEHIPAMSGSRIRSAGFHLFRAFNRFAHWRRRNTRDNSRRNIREHYDLSNDFYALWLDETMTYSSAWFEGEQSLRSAQENKYHRLCSKLGLRPGMRVLEIGCGWGGFSIHAARHFGVHMTAITISEAQFEKASQRVREEGLEDRVEVRLCDYRDVEGQFDAIASIEMIEAVGHEFLKIFFDKCHHLLKPTGRVGLQVIICPDCRYDAMRRSVDWIKKHIFPGGQLPSVKALVDSVNATGDLYLQHLESFGLHYARTLELWRERFNRQRDAVMAMGFDETFLRKWNYYLAYCEAAFATRNINVSQMILSRPNNTEFSLEA